MNKKIRTIKVKNQFFKWIAINAFNIKNISNYQYPDSMVDTKEISIINFKDGSSMFTTTKLSFLKEKFRPRTIPIKTHNI